MTIQVFGAEATVSYLNRAFNDTSPSYAVFQNQVNRIGGTNGKVGIGDAAFANEFGANFSGLSNAALSKLVLTNMGILPTTDTSVAALEQALTDYFAAFGTPTKGTNGQVTADSRGFIVLQLATILAGLENAEGNQAVYKAAATAWNNEVTASYTYSINPANINPSPAGALSSGNTYNLVAGVDTFTGTAGNDTFNAGTVDSLSAFDALDGGAGTDSLTALLSSATSLPGSATITNIENVSISTGGAGFTADATTPTLSGVTALKVAASGTGAINITAPITTAVTAAAAGSSAGAKEQFTVTVTDVGTTAKTFTLEGVTTNVPANAGVKEIFNYTVTETSGTAKTFVFDGITVNLGTTETASVTACAAAIVANYNANSAANWVATNNAGIITFTAKTAGAVTDKAAGDFTGTAAAGTVSTPTQQGLANASDTTAAATSLVTAYNANANVAWVASNAANVVTFTAKTAGALTDKVAGDITGALTTTFGSVTTQGGFATGGAGTVTVVGAGGVLNATAGSGANVNVGQTAVANAITEANIVGGGLVNIRDQSAGTSTAPAVGSKLTTVSLNGNTGAATLESKGLTTLNLTKNTQDVTITNSTASHTLTVNTNGATGGTVTDSEATTLNVVNTGTATTASSFTTAKATAVNLTATGKDLTVTNLTAVLAKAVNVAGDAKVTITADTLDAAAVITSTNTKRVDVTQALAAGQKFVGAAGADTITVPVIANGAAGASTVANTLGEGDDTVNITFVASAALGTGGSIDGGAGNDTLRVSGTAGYATVPGITGFETLGVATAGSGTFDATGFTGLTEGGSAAVVFSNVAAGVGLSITASPTSTTAVNLKDSSGTSDAFTLTVASNATTPVAVAAGTVTTDGVENLTIASNGVATGTANTVTVSDKNLRTLTITGSSDLTLTTGTADFGTTNGAAATTAVPGVSLIDASAATGKFVFDDATNSKLVPATAGLTIKGGSADDTISLGTIASKAANTITLGGGKDVLTLKAPNTSSAIFTTVTDFAVGDTLSLGSTTLVSANGGAKLGAKLVSGVDDYQTFLNAASSQYATTAAGATANVGAAATVSWFQVGGNTYIVQDNDGKVTYTAGTDYIVKLTGLVDLTNATIATTVITMA